MPKSKTSKIFIRHGKEAAALLWADMCKDGTVMLGIPSSVEGQVEFVADVGTEFRPPEIISKKSDTPLKVSFHPSGHYKLSCEMGKDESTTDRATVVGPELADIDAPRLMAEFLIPQAVLPAKKKYTPTDKDIILDATALPEKPLRCSVFCMSNDAHEKLTEQFKTDASCRFVSTSTHECVHGLENDTHTWVFVLRISENDNNYPDRLILGVLGIPKWGNNIS